MRRHGGDADAGCDESHGAGDGNSLGSVAVGDGAGERGRRACANHVSDHVRANIVGYVALFLATTGVSWAAGLQPDSVRSKHIVDGQVKNQDLADGAVGASKVAPDSLGGAQVNESSLAKVSAAQTADNAAALGGQAPSAFQQRVSGTCSGSQAVQSIAANGTVACGGGGSLPQNCTNGQVAKSNGANAWACAADANTTYSAAPNGGLALTGTAFGLSNCPTGQVLKSTGASTWSCAADASGGSPTGAATGDLTGSYPSPQIAGNAVNSAKVADNTLTGNDIDEGTFSQARVDKPSSGLFSVVGNQSLVFTAKALPAAQYVFMAELEIEPINGGTGICWLQDQDFVVIDSAGVGAGTRHLSLMGTRTMSAGQYPLIHCHGDPGTAGFYVRHPRLVSLRMGQASSDQLSPNWIGP